MAQETLCSELHTCTVKNSYKKNKIRNFCALNEKEMIYAIEFYKRTNWEIQKNKPDIPIKLYLILRMKHNSMRTVLMSFVSYTQTQSSHEPLNQGIKMQNFYFCLP